MRARQTTSQTIPTTVSPGACRFGPRRRAQPQGFPRPRRPAAQSGVVLLELAVSGLLFFGLVFAIIEFGRFMLTLGTAAEATRIAARLAAICTTGPTDTAAQGRVRNTVISWVQTVGYKVPAAQANTWLSFDYQPSGCTSASCTSVEARINGFSANLMIPIKPLNITVPPLPARVMREPMATTVNGANIPACP